MDPLQMLKLNFSAKQIFDDKSQKSIQGDWKVPDLPTLNLKASCVSIGGYFKIIFFSD
jgi:hypothetical protein